MATTLKHLKGRVVQLTPEEDAALLEDRERQRARPTPFPKEVPTLLLYDVLLERGTDLDQLVTGRTKRRFDLSNVVRLTDPLALQYARMEGHDPPEPFLQQLFRDVEARRLAGETERET